MLAIPFKVVLSKVAVLAHTTGVVRPVWVATSIGHLGLALPVVAIVAHVLGVVLLVGMWALEDLSSLSLARDRLLVIGWKQIRFAGGVFPLNSLIALFT